MILRRWTTQGASKQRRVMAVAWIALLVLVRSNGEGAILQRATSTVCTNDLNVLGTIFYTSSQGVLPCCGTTDTEQEMTLTGLPSVLTQWQTYTVTLSSISVTARQVGVFFSNGSAYINKLYPSGNMFTVANRTLTFTLTATAAGPLTMLVNAFPGTRTFQYTVTLTTPPATQFYRLEILSARTPFATSLAGIQFSELKMNDSSNSPITLTSTTYSTPLVGSGTIIAAEVLSKAFDGDLGTKFNFATQAVSPDLTTTPPLNLYMNLTTQKSVCRFALYTANDSPIRDPYIFRFYRSDDYIFWMPMTSRLQASATDPGRMVLLGSYAMCT